MTKKRIARSDVDPVRIRSRTSCTATPLIVHRENIQTTHGAESYPTFAHSASAVLKAVPSRRCKPDHMIERTCKSELHPTKFAHTILTIHHAQRRSSSISLRAGTRRSVERFVRLTNLRRHEKSSRLAGQVARHFEARPSILRRPIL
jgi:hypothetical protein